MYTRTIFRGGGVYAAKPGRRKYNYMYKRALFSCCRYETKFFQKLIIHSLHVRAGIHIHVIIHILCLNIVFLILKLPVENVSVEKRDNLMKASIILIYTQIHVIWNWIQVKRTGYNTLYMYLVVVFWFKLKKIYQNIRDQGCLCLTLVISLI